MRNINIGKQLQEALGVKLTPAAMWEIVKLAKHVRLRCRNNAAFNNWFNAAFPHLKFEQVQKQRPSRYNPAIPEYYPGLKITERETGASHEGDDSDE